MPEARAAITEQVRIRVLRWFARSGLLDPADARDMLAWANSGFSVDASVCIAGPDRVGLERLLRYCARPRFAVRFTGYSRQSVGNYQGQLLADCGQSGDSWHDRPVSGGVTGDPPPTARSRLGRTIRRSYGSAPTPPILSYVFRTAKPVDAQSVQWTSVAIACYRQHGRPNRMKTIAYLRVPTDD